MSFPKVHIAIVGIEKLIPSITDLDLFWPLLATHGTGQNMTVYNSIISGPKKDGETDGPDEMYLVLLENNRSELLKKEVQRVALSCIRCGACLNACPVYKNIGGHSYGTTYSGPIGSVITPFLKGMDEYKHLCFASSLCGACTEVCPVKIPLHELLLYNRSDVVKEGYMGSMDKLMVNAWTRTMMKRSRMDFFKASYKNFVLRTFFKKVWGPRREVPKVAPKSFREMWIENNPK
jgi:L-lactate dehydrogenase complex protein LldF